MARMGYEAFVFDLDDTLVNTSMVVFSVMESWCEENGIDFSEASRASLGTRIRDTVARVAPHLDAPSEAKEIEEWEAAALVGLQPRSPGSVRRFAVGSLGNCHFKLACSR